MHLDLDHPSFNEGRVQANPAFFIAFLKKVRQLEQGTLADFKEWNHECHQHYIEWDDTNEPDGFAGTIPENELWRDTPWQCQIETGKPWRVHGFLLESTFNIVWLDPDHLLYKQRDDTKAREGC